MYATIPDQSSFPLLRNKVVVLTGGSSGIGAALTTLLHSYGSHVVFGDINRSAGIELAKSCGSGTGTGTVTFVRCDVTKYSDVYSLFRVALDKHGKVDHAISCAGIVDDPNASYFDPGLNIDSVNKDEGDKSVLDVNFLGSCYFARIALPFLRHGRQTIAGTDDDRSLTFLSSVVGFRDAPGMFLYQTSKQAILGLMRSLRSSIHARDKIRVNAICPGMTESALTADFIHLFRNTPADLPAHHQTAADVAQHLVAVMLAEDMNGKSVYVEAGKGWEFEDGLAREMPRWLGEEPTRLSDENLRFIQSLGGI